MLDDKNINLPPYYPEIDAASRKIAFSMPSDLQTGALLRTLVASKPNGRFLDIGTGTGLSLAWIAEGATDGSVILSIDIHSGYQQIARDIFSKDKRITLICTDAAVWLSDYAEDKFDLIFADAWPGKYEVLEETLQLIKPGGFYLIDDLLPQPNWPEGHGDNVDRLVKLMSGKKDFVQTTFNWSTGLMLFTKIA